MDEHASTIVEQFADKGIELDHDQVVNKLQTLTDEYHVPADEAVRSVTNKLADLHGIDPAEVRGNSTEFTDVGTIDEGENWIDVEVSVTDIGEANSDSVAQRGRVGDESGTVRFVSWAKSDLQELEVGKSYRLENVVTDEYQGTYSIKLNANTEITALDKDIEVADEGSHMVGAVVSILNGSGLIKRCPEEDCSRVLNNGTCAEHGEGDGEFDLRIKAVLDDGVTNKKILFDEEATEDLLGLDMTAAIEMAQDALDTSVVADEIRDRLVGRYLEVTGVPVGQYVLVEESNFAGGMVEMAEDPPSINGGAGGQQEARRVFAGEFNNATHSFTEDPDDERAPNFVLLPTGQRANRVFIVGTLTETEDVGQESEYWRGRVVDPNGDTYFVYAGQYQVDSAALLRQLEPPAYVAVVGKPRTYQPDEDGDTYVSLAPEDITVVNGEIRNQWVVETAQRTQDRIQAFDPESDGTDGEDARMAQEEYDVDLAAYEELVDEAIESLENNPISNKTEGDKPENEPEADQSGSESQTQSA